MRTGIRLLTAIKPAWAAGGRWQGRAQHPMRGLPPLLQYLHDESAFPSLPFLEPFHHFLAARRPQGVCRERGYHRRRSQQPTCRSRQHRCHRRPRCHRHWRCHRHHHPYPSHSLLPPSLPPLLHQQRPPPQPPLNLLLQTVIVALVAPAPTAQRLPIRLRSLARWTT